MQQFVKYSRTIERLQQGSLSEYIGLCASLLKQQGYSRALVQSRILLISRFSRWLERNGIETYTIEACTLQRFLRDYKRNPFKGKAGRYQAGDKLLTYLKGL
jgi:hypothetical protein